MVGKSCLSEVLWRFRASCRLRGGVEETQTHTQHINSVTKLKCLLYICDEKKKLLLVICGVTAHPFPITSSNFMQLRETIQTLSTASINSRVAEDSMVGNSHMMMAGNNGGGVTGCFGHIGNATSAVFVAAVDFSQLHSLSVSLVLITAAAAAAAVMSSGPAASL